MDSPAKAEGDALAEGRRIYIGNLDYVLRPVDIEELLKANNFENFESIHISVDPVSARNPGYCFVDFVDRETAERAISSLIVTIRGREIKVGPCEPKKKRFGGRDIGGGGFQRWGNWKSPDENEGETSQTHQRRQGRQGPDVALAHFDGVREDYRGQRLYVGGLSAMIDQEHNRMEITAIFEGFKPAAIGKRITPHPGTRSLKGDYHYCFVDFDTVDEAEEAMKALDNKPYQGGHLKVSMARQIPKKLIDRSEEGADRKRWGQSKKEGDDAASSNRALSSSNWRRKE